MCGRYLRRSGKQRLAEAFHVDVSSDHLVLAPDYNVAPSTFQPVIRLHRDTGAREIVAMRWGLVPYFAKSLADWKGFSSVNAKAESVATKPLWRAPFQKRRCLVPVDGYYEWKKLSPGTKQPFLYTLKHTGPFALAGLWDAWKDPRTGEWLQSFAVITTGANELAADVHDRMPVLLRPRDYDRWLQRSETTFPSDLLRPYDAEDMCVVTCNPAVGNVRNNGPEMLICPEEKDEALHLLNSQ